MTSTFHDYYMEVVTSSFGDDLDHIRQVWHYDLLANMAKCALTKISWSLWIASKITVFNHYCTAL